MTLQSIVKDLNQIYQRLFDHSPAAQGECGAFQAAFEDHGRGRELDHLLHTCHMLNEAVETETELRLARAPLDRLMANTNAATANILRTVNAQNKSEHEDYVQTIRKEQDTEWNNFQSEIEKKREEVDTQCSQRLDELRSQYANVQHSSP